MVSNRPIRRLRLTEDETDLVLDLRDPLARLAALPPALMTAPEEASQYLTVSLDWRPHGSDPGRRPARRQFDDAASAVLPLTAAAQGVLIVARSDADVFVALPIAVAVPTEVTVGPIPALAALARVADDFATFAVLLADQKEASLTFVTQARHERGVVAYGAEYPFKRKAGGAQRRYQARADERRDQFARAVADGARRALDEAGIDVLIIAGDEVITSPLNRLFHQTVADRIVGTVRLDVTAPMADIIEATLPIDEEAERTREAAVVTALRGAVEAGGPGAAGPPATLSALKHVRVETLVMTDDFSAPGWADYSADVPGVGPIPDRHPTGGDRGQIVPIRVEDEMIRRAVLTGAKIKIVRTDVPAPQIEDGLPKAGEPLPRAEAARQLDALGGVGALLRFG